ncbi:MAG TPA: TGS domain-containing protein, partial [Burkholderiaceae bacterium]|nr:TGS domain-containing protein [Burkholderiaceae bacterium]
REREEFVASVTATLRELLSSAGVRAEVSGRPKHIYSIWNKMRSKRLALDDIRDLRGLRVIVDDVRECYSALALIHSRWTPLHEEFDDYIARPKPNGYQSLHTVVMADDGRPLEVQIRTREMHQFAEYGVASHWRYKERSTGVAGSQRADAAQDQRIAWVRQLLAWQREVGENLGAPVLGGAHGLAVPSLVDEENVRIYALTPQARVIELPAGATPVDFAYHVHSTLGHRCRGARVDGHLVPLNTPLANGQTVEIITARPGSGAEGPSRDWLNPQLGYVRSPRARTKVRQWFNALELARDVAAGREKVERTMAREGRTALSFDELSARLSQPDVQAMFVAVAREEIGPRQLEEAVRGPQAADAGTSAGADDAALPAVLAAAAERARARSKTDNDGVLVVGVDLLLTQLARCCRPVPPDPIRGFVTKGRGVSVHRASCPTFAQMARRAPERVLDTDWGRSSRPGADRERAYAVDVVVRANDRAGLLRDVSEVFARDRLNVTAVHTQSRSHVAHMQFTVEVQDVAVLNRTLAAIREVGGVFEATRR